MSFLAGEAAQDELYLSLYSAATVHDKAATEDQQQQRVYLLLLSVSNSGVFL